MLCRCETLVHNEGKEYAKAHLEEIAIDDTNWRILYKCPEAEIYWQQSYPRSEEHGGGPALFERVTREQATQLFDI